MTASRLSTLFAIAFITFVAAAATATTTTTTTFSVPGYKAPRCVHDEVAKGMEGKIPVMPQRYPRSRSLSLKRRDVNSSRVADINATGPLRIDLRYDLVDNINADSNFACIKAGDTVTLPSSSKKYECSSGDVITASKKKYLASLMADTVSKIASLLNVVQVEGTLDLKCKGYAFNSIFLEDESGVKSFNGTDLVVYVTVRPAGSNDVYATGQTLATDDNGRPVLGNINWNPALLTPPASDDDNKNIVEGMYHGIAFHEMLHVLGFSSGMFRTYRDAYGEPWEDTIATRSIDGREVSFLTTPRVLDAVRTHYGCSAGNDGYDALIGATLEDQGGSGTMGSHWEKAAFMDEVMTGSAPYNPVISNVTLAALHDSGWYLPNYDQAEWLAWGEGKGCKFSTYRCDNGWPRTGGYYCTKSDDVGCTYDRKAVGGCQVAKKEGLDELYQHQGLDTNVAGVDELADYCPYIRFYSNTLCTKEVAMSSPNDYGETYDGTGRCFHSTVFSSVLSLAGSINYKCYPVHCASPTELNVKIGEYWYACPNASTKISPKGYYGTLTCAAAAEICPRNTPVDESFPRYLGIEPRREYPGNPVTIRGTHLSNITSVEIGYECKIINQSDTHITCIVSNSPTMETILGAPVDVILTSSFMNISFVDPDGFTPLVAWKKWAEDNAFLLFCLLLAVLALFLTIGIITIKCKDTRAKNKKKQKKRQQTLVMTKKKMENTNGGGGDGGGGGEDV